MRLMLDQNISYRPVKELSDVYPSIKHVKSLGLLNKEDQMIWNFAKDHDYTIVTFDADFFEFQLTKGFPPKLIWLRFGNSTRSELKKFFFQKRKIIEKFLNDEEFKDIGCLGFDSL
ncbi:DUF5615 family PIN-like protein [Ekhidna sp.]|uniref:DUF5615 family PIN-like protein n=1 Tax=Ekhidna sp. TaxID=2608089 RepID=UPI003CCBDD92